MTDSVAKQTKPDAREIERLRKRAAQADEFIALLSELGSFQGNLRDRPDLRTRISDAIASNRAYVMATRGSSANPLPSGSVEPTRPAMGDATRNNPGSRSGWPTA